MELTQDASWWWHRVLIGRELVIASVWWQRTYSTAWWTMLFSPFLEAWVGWKEGAGDCYYYNLEGEKWFTKTSLQMLTEVHYKIKVGFLKTGTCGKAPVITASIWPASKKVTFGSTPFQNGCLYWLLVLAWELQQGFSAGWTLVPGIGMRLFAVGVWQACLHPSFISMDLTPAAFTLTWERLLDRFNSFRVTCAVDLVKT